MGLTLLAPSFHAMKTGGILCEHQPELDHLV